MSGTPLLKKTNVNNKSPRFCSRFYVNLRTGKNRKSHMPVISLMIQTYFKYIQDHLDNLK